MLTWWGRCLVLLLFASVLVIVVYYEQTSEATGFEKFMDSEGYGVKFFFTGLGVVLGECMQMIFGSKSWIPPQGPRVLLRASWPSHTKSTHPLTKDEY